MADDDDNVCTICYVAYGQLGLHMPRALECGHSFCSSCVDNLTQSASSSGLTCPTCCKPFQLRLAGKPQTSAQTNAKSSSTSHMAPVASGSALTHHLVPPRPSPVAAGPAKAFLQPSTATSTLPRQSPPHSMSTQTIPIKGVHRFAPTISVGDGSAVSGSVHRNAGSNLRSATVPAAVTPPAPSAPRLTGALQAPVAVTAMALAAAFATDVARLSATDCLATTPAGACANGSGCSFRHRHLPQAASPLAICRDWCVRRSGSGPYCPRGAACPLRHPHRRIVGLTDCPEKRRGAACAQGGCAYTSGLPCTLRHTAIAPNAGDCAAWNDATAGHRCAAGAACTKFHGWRSG